MNEKVLIHYLSHRLHTYIRQFSANGEELCSYCGIVGFEDSCLAQASLIPLINEMTQSKMPLLFTLEHQIVYALIPVRDTAFLIGPVRFEGNVPIHQNQKANIDTDWLSTVFICPFDDFIAETLFLYNLYASKTLSQNALLEKNLAQKHLYENTQEKYVKIIFDNQENEIRHNPYAQEVREQQSIENGDIEQLEKSWSEDYTGEIGTLAKEPIRHHKNLCIVLVTLACRSAIRGGLSPELSFSLSDSYIQQIEEINDINSLLLFSRQMEYQYTSLVHDIREQKKHAQKDKKNPHIEQCKDYIFSHLHDRITVDEIASALGYNPNYLSHLFKQCEGIGLSQYIIREKINRAKNLLMYSDYSYIKIAAYLGFSSQSHLGTHFKKYTGYTLHQFRELFQRRE